MSPRVTRRLLSSRNSKIYITQNMSTTAVSSLTSVSCAPLASNWARLSNDHWSQITLSPVTTTLSTIHDPTWTTLIYQLQRPKNANRPSSARRARDKTRPLLRTSLSRLKPPGEPPGRHAQRPDWTGRHLYGRASHWTWCVAIEHPATFPFVRTSFAIRFPPPFQLQSRTNQREGDFFASR